MSWHCKKTGAYTETSAEAYENAVEIYNYLTGQGWSLNAIAGVIGNIGHEGGYNPWRWQSDDVLPKGSSAIYSKSHGYGLFQYTPASKYIENGGKYSGFGPNYSDEVGSTSDGLAQVALMASNELGDYIKTSKYNLTFSQFKTSTQSAEYLAAAWLYNFERPADPTATVAARQKSAAYWYDKLGGVTPATGHYINILVNGNGAAWAIPSKAESGVTISLYESAGDGAEFEGWTVTAGGVDIVDNSFTMPDNDVYITATFTGETPRDFKPWLLYFFKNSHVWSSLNIHY